MRWCWTVALAIGLASGQSQAEELDTFVELGWEGAAYADDVTGEFTGCAIAATYNSDATLAFRLTGNYDFEVWVGHPDWLLRPEETIPAVLAVDSVPPFSGSGIALSTKVIAFPFESTEANYQLFRMGRSLTVQFQNRRYEFLLDGTARALDKLLTCVQIYAEPTERIASAPTSTAADRSALRLEATELATNIASAAGITGFIIVSDADLRADLGSPDVLWAADGLIGAANVIDIPDISIDDAATFGWLARGGCEGGRDTAIKREVVDGIDMVNVGVRCWDNDGGLISVTKTIAPRPGGGFLEFAFAVVDDGDTGATEPPVADLQDAVFRVVGNQ